MQSTTHRLVAATILLLVTSAIGNAAGNAVEKTIINSAGIELLLVPSGTLMMGSDDADRTAAASEKPRRQVTISKPFYLGKYEVTQAQWEAVMGSNPYTSSRSNPFYGLPGMAERITKPDHPATVSWNDAQEFIRRLNEKEGHTRYRLPTEAEWEYAARAGSTTAYSFGDDPRELATYAWYGEDFATGGTHPVGKKQPNPWGFCDIHGNVWEWVQDFYGERPSAAPSTDPTGPRTGTAHVVKGGSWHQTATSWRSAFRKPYEPDYRGISIGFRLAMTAE
jgi:formylglycine-generating enzyme required for sulfatase activity